MNSKDPWGDSRATNTTASYYEASLFRQHNQTVYAERLQEQALKAWFREASNADWASPAEIKAAFRTASIVRNNRVVFNVCGNKYRLVVKVNYAYRVVYIRFIGTHAQYDRIDVEEV